MAIAVTERVPAMAVRMADGGYDLVDPTGIIVRWATAKPAGLPLLTTPLSGAALRGRSRCRRRRRGARRARALAGRGTVSSVSVGPQVLTGAGGHGGRTAQQVTLSAAGGKTVVWGDPGNAAAKNRELRSCSAVGRRATST